MSERVLRINNPADAEEVIEYFNGFHDGFIKRLEVTSRDTFALAEPGDPSIAHELTGKFDVKIDIAHYNYGVDGLQPFDRAIRCGFFDVHDLCLDLRGVGESDWPIKVVEIEAAAGQESGAELNAEASSDRRFALVFHWSHLVDNQWSTRSAQLLTFAAAEFEEFTLI